MTNRTIKQAVVTTDEAKSAVDSTGSIESLTLPVGTFAGTQDRILRIRNGKPVPADTGDQGGGQN
jgi:hypothetical protein